MGNYPFWSKQGVKQCRLSGLSLDLPQDHSTNNPLSDSDPDAALEQLYKQPVQQIALSAIGATQGSQAAQDREASFTQAIPERYFASRQDA